MNTIVLYSFLISIMAVGSMATSMMLGGLSEPKAVDSELKDLAIGFQGDVEKSMGTSFTSFTPISYSSQIVAGVNYFVKVKVSPGDIVYLRIFKPLPGNNASPTLVSSQPGSSDDLGIPYF